MNSFIIYDGQGYWVARRRVEGRIINMWSPRKEDAAPFHFVQVAEKIVTGIPQPVQIMPARVV